jgi:acetoacetyl-CoA synthetase
MAGAKWFPGARLNYAEHALRHERTGDDALLFLSERRAPTPLSWTELGGQVRKLATLLRKLGLDMATGWLRICQTLRRLS